MAPLVGGCGDDDDDSSGGDGDSDGDTDADSDGDTDGDADCVVQPPADPAAGWCPWGCNDPTKPDFRMTALTITQPAALNNQIISSVIGPAMDDGTFVWLVDNVGDGTFRTGSGTCTDATLADCSFDGAPTTGDMDINAANGEFRIPAGTGTIDVDAVIHSDTLGAITLRLKEGSITGTVGSNGNCVGLRTNDVTASTWDTDGHVSGKMTTTDADAVTLDANLGGGTLCDFLAAGLHHAGYCHDNAADPTAWTNAPDTMVGTDPAWSFEGDIAAQGVNIY